MSYPSNYPSYGGAYGGGGYPPNSGPPPPPYGGGYHGAYDVNQYGSQYGGGMGQGAVPGFTVPAMQNLAFANQAMAQQAPPRMDPPVSNIVNSYDQHLYQWQMDQQKRMMDIMEERFKRLEDKQERGEKISAEEAREVEKVKTGDLKRLMKEKFVDELKRREEVSGTFELTEGTVKPLVEYPADDPVVEFHKKMDTNLEGKPWDKEADCQYLRDAMNGLGTNEAAITHVVATRCNSQRQKLKFQFKVAFGRDLIEDIKSELSGDYRETVMACFVPPADYDAWSVKEAIYGLGTDEKTLIEIMMTRTNAQIQEMRKAYVNVASPHRKESDSLLDDDIKGDTSGDFKRLLISSAQGGRNDITKDRLMEAVEEIVVDGHETGMFQVNYEKLCNMDDVRRDAKLLNKAGEERWGTDEETFNRIFSTRDYYTLRAIWNEYVKITQRDILNSIDRETSGDFKRGLRGIVMNIRCRPMFFAERLVSAMKGLGTKDKDLIRIIVSRSEIDMVQIKECFLKLTNQTLWRWLKDDCSGDYKKLLQALVGRD